MNSENLENKLSESALAIQNADAILVTAGAGFGVDSGLPDFRGDKGFWNAYPMYQNLGLSFVEAANPTHFSRDPHFGWGFYGHRLELYRKTIPHKGFNLIRKWINHFGLDSFVVTSNVDGHFQKAGFSSNSIYEVHGSIHHLQCTKPCSHRIWSNRQEISVDSSTMRAYEVPVCPHCNGVARPNILMFGDYFWIADRSNEQDEQFQGFLNRHQRSRLVVIELGAGTAVPTIRYISEQVSNRIRDALVIRINLRESMISKPNIALPMGALEALQKIEATLSV